VEISWQEQDPCLSAVKYEISYTIHLFRSQMILAFTPLVVL